MLSHGVSLFSSIIVVSGGTGTQADNAASFHLTRDDPGEWQKSQDLDLMKDGDTYERSD